MADTEGNDTEITLGMGKLLGAVLRPGDSLRHFARGWLLAGTQFCPAGGRGARSPRLPRIRLSSTANKPGASQVAAPKTPDCPTGDNCPPQATSTPNTTDLTFYQTVQQKDEHPQLTPPETGAVPLSPACPGSQHARHRVSGADCRRALSGRRQTAQRDAPEATVSGHRQPARRQTVPRTGRPLRRYQGSRGHPRPSGRRWLQRFPQTLARHISI